MLGYTPLGHMLGENDKIKTKYALDLTQIQSLLEGLGGQVDSGIDAEKTFNDVKTKIITYIIIFAIIAFLISFFSNNKCNMVPRLIKSVIAALLGLIYIILFLIKYSLSNC